ncbi:MAG: hypothetical protein ISS63_07295 [Desulfobacteraceae bacterium]|nr:hypothetical protein [Desulfobacteraceae bacterium]
MAPFTRRRPFEDIKKELRPHDVIGIINCNTCSKFMGTGGPDSLDWIKSELRKEGYRRAEEYIFVTPCFQDAVKKNIHFGETTTTIILQSCSSGVLSAKLNFPDKRIVTANIDAGEAIVFMSKGRAKLVTPAKGFEDKVDTEYSLMTGEEMKDRIITELKPEKKGDIKEVK